MYGELNGHAIGIILKELVRRAIAAIRNQWQSYEIQHKDTLGRPNDIVTSADKAAQAIYLKSLQECFPYFGIVAEEDGFRKPCLFEQNKIYLSVDPLDGTAAFARNQSHGVGTQVALLINDVIESAWVGDVNTKEIFGFRPGSRRVWRIREYDVAQKMTVNVMKPLSQQYLLMREGPDSFPPYVKWMLRGDSLISRPKLFKNLEVTGGSVGIAFARLWKGEVGSILLEPFAETPWDIWPTVGISLRMGFVFLRADEHGHFIRYEPSYNLEPVEEKGIRLIIHQSRLAELETWQSKK